MVGEKGLGFQGFLVAPNSYLPLPPSGPSTNSENHISSQISSLLLFLLIFLPFMKNDFLELATTSKFPMLKMKGTKYIIVLENTCAMGGLVLHREEPAFRE